MSQNFTLDEIGLAKERLGLTSQRLLFVFRAAQMDRVQELLHDLINQTRKHFRTWLLQLHPDHNPDDPIKHREFLVLAFVWSELKSLKDPGKARQYWLAVHEEERKSATPFRTYPTFLHSARAAWNTTTDIYSSTSTDTPNQNLDSFAFGIFSTKIQ